MALTPSRLLSVTVCLVLSAYAFVCYTTIQLVIFPSLGPELTTPLVLHLSAFSAIALLGLVSYAAAVTIDPGSVAPGWMPDAEGNNDMAVQEVKSVSRRKTGTFSGSFCSLLVSAPCIDHFAS